MAFFDDFKKFAFRGNVVDLAVGVVIGSAFGKIVSAMVNDLVMPLVSLFMPSGNWRGAGMLLRHGNDVRDDVVLQYGDFMGALLDFFIIALVLFILVKRIILALERPFVHNDRPVVPTQRPCPQCLSEVPIAATRCKFCTGELPVYPGETAAPQ